MASLTGYRVANPMLLTEADLPATDRPRYRPVACAAALFAADCLAIATAVGCTALITRQFGLLGNWGNPLIPPDLVVLFAAIIGYLAIHGRYSERIAFWNELRLVVCGSFWAIVMGAALGVLAVIWGISVFDNSYRQVWVGRTADKIIAGEVFPREALNASFTELEATRAADSCRSTHS